MKKTICICAVLLLVLVGGLWLLNHLRREQDLAELAAYKAQLRAQGADKAWERNRAGAEPPEA